MKGRSKPFLSENSPKSPSMLDDREKLELKRRARMSLPDAVEANTDRDALSPRNPQIRVAEPQYESGFFRKSLQVPEPIPSKSMDGSSPRAGAFLDSAAQAGHRLLPNVARKPQVVPQPWFLIQPRRHEQPRHLWRKLRYCVFGLDPASVALNAYAQTFAVFVLGFSVIECLCETFILGTVSFDVWVGRRLITGNWRHFVYLALHHPVESILLTVAVKVLKFILDDHSWARRIMDQLLRGLLCFALILMSHRVCSGLLAFFVSFECKSLEHEIHKFLGVWRSLKRPQRQQGYSSLLEHVQRLDKKLFFVLHYVFCEHVIYIMLDVADHSCAVVRNKNLLLYAIRHCVGVALSCIALWHCGVLNWTIYEGIYNKIIYERWNLRDSEDQTYRRELKDWHVALHHGVTLSRPVGMQLFSLRFGLTSNTVALWVTTLVVWPLVARTLMIT